MKIDPWANEGVQNYKEICDKFGLDIVDYTKLPSPTHLHRRGIIFAHRDLDNVLEAKKAGRPFGVLSGLMPSCLLYTSPSPRDGLLSRMPSSA